MPRILLVEDSKLTRKIAMAALSDSGYEIVQAHNGKEALEVLNISTEEFCCIITDLLMPQMSGQELLQRLREMSSSIPVIVISADVQESTREECFQLGVKHFLSKPLSKSELIETLKLVLSD